MTLVDEYRGPVNDTNSAAAAVEAIGGGPGLPTTVTDRFGQSDGNGFVGFWEAMARRVLRAEPELLEWRSGP